MDVLLFGGTTEGRLLAEWLAARGTCGVVACSATEYGASLVAGSERVTPVVGPLSQDDKRRLVEDHDFCCVVDATHPYAEHISASVDELARAGGLDVVRVVRDGGGLGDWTCVGSVAEAARHVAARDGNVLATTGAKELAAYVGAMPDFCERLYVRVLPVEASVARARELGIPASHIVAMQGPFSAGLNRALIREFDVACLVTKRSGVAGGFFEKAQAAEECGVELVVVERPQPQGEARARQALASPDAAHAATLVSLEGAKDVLEVRYGL